MSSLAEPTVKHYNKILLEFHEFIQLLGPQYGSFPANPAHVILFIAYLFDKGLSPSTITSKLSAISYVHKLHNLSDPCSHFIVQKAIVGARKIAPSVDSRLPVTLQMLEMFVKYCYLVTPSHYYRALLKAMVTVGFYALLRPGEMTGSVNNLQYEHVNLSDDSITIKFVKFKHHVGEPVIVKVAAQGGLACPVNCLKAFLP